MSLESPSNTLANAIRFTHLRILYTINTSPQYILARSQREVAVSIIPTSPHLHCEASLNDKKSHLSQELVYGKVSLTICLDTICRSSPELMQDSGRDFSVYVLDPLEPKPSAAAISLQVSCNPASSSELNLHQGIRPLTSHEADGSVAVGLGLMSWALLADDRSSSLVTGTMKRDVAGRDALEIVFALRETAHLRRNAISETVKSWGLPAKPSKRTRLHASTSHHHSSQENLPHTSSNALYTLSDTRSPLLSGVSGSNPRRKSSPPPPGVEIYDVDAESGEDAAKHPMQASLSSQRLALGSSSSLLGLSTDVSAQQRRPTAHKRRAKSKAKDATTELPSPFVKVPLDRKGSGYTMTPLEDHAASPDSLLLLSRAELPPEERFNLVLEPEPPGSVELHHKSHNSASSVSCLSSAVQALLGTLPRTDHNVAIVSALATIDSPMTSSESAVHNPALIAALKQLLSAASASNTYVPGDTSNASLVQTRKISDKENFRPQGPLEKGNENLLQKQANAVQEDNMDHPCQKTTRKRSLSGVLDDTGRRTKQDRKRQLSDGGDQHIGDDHMQHSASANSTSVRRKAPFTSPPRQNSQSITAVVPSNAALSMTQPDSRRPYVVPAWARTNTTTKPRIVEKQRSPKRVKSTVNCNPLGKGKKKCVASGRSLDELPVSDPGRSVAYSSSDHLTQARPSSASSTIPKPLTAGCFDLPIVLSNTSNPNNPPPSNRVSQYGQASSGTVPKTPPPNQHSPHGYLFASGFEFEDHPHTSSLFTPTPKVQRSPSTSHTLEAQRSPLFSHGLHPRDDVKTLSLNSARVRVSASPVNQAHRKDEKNERVSDKKSKLGFDDVDFPSSSLPIASSDDGGDDDRFSAFEGHSYSNPASADVGSRMDGKQHWSVGLPPSSPPPPSSPTILPIDTEPQASMAQVPMSPIHSDIDIPFPSSDVSFYGQSEQFDGVFDFPLHSTHASESIVLGDFSDLFSGREEFDLQSPRGTVSNYSGMTYLPDNFGVDTSNFFPTDVLQNGLGDLDFTEAWESFQALVDSSQPGSLQVDEGGRSGIEQQDDDDKNLTATLFPGGIDHEKLAGDLQTLLSGCLV